MIKIIPSKIKFSKEQDKSILLILVLFISTMIFLGFDFEFLGYFLNICALCIMTNQIYKGIVEIKQIPSHWILITLSIIIMIVCNYMWFFYMVAVTKIQEYEYQYLFIANTLSPALIFVANLVYFARRFKEDIKERLVANIDMISIFLALAIFTVGLLDKFDYTSIFLAPAPFAYFLIIILSVLNIFIVMIAFFSADQIYIRQSILCMMIGSLLINILNLYDAHENIIWIGSGEDVLSLPYDRGILLPLQILILLIFMIGIFHLNQVNKRVRQDSILLSSSATWLPLAILIPISIQADIDIKFIFFIIFVLTAHALISHYARSNIRSKELVKKEKANHENLKAILEKQTNKQSLATLKLREMLNRDSLTGLSNRNFLIYELSNMLDEGQHCIGLYCINIHQFRLINRAYGHHIGDKLLKEVAKILLDQVEYINIETNKESKNTYVVSRFGADEFVLIHIIKSRDEFEKFAEEILKNLSKPFYIDSHKFDLVYKIGADMICQEDIKAEGNQIANELLKNADKALHNIKDSSKSTICFYSKDIDKKVNELSKIGIMLQNSNINKDFDILFEPIFDLKSMNITGVKTLLCWDNNHDKIIIEAKNISQITQNNHLNSCLCAFNATKSIEILSKIQASGLKIPKVSIGIIQQQLNSPVFVVGIREILTKYSLRPEILEIEFLENIWSQPKETLDDILYSIKEFGMSICIDEFGAGHSSLKHIKKYGINRVKIASSLTDSSKYSNEIQISLIKSVIDIANILDLQTTAKCVNDKDTINMLKKFGCMEAMGSALCEPMNKDEFEIFLKRNQHKIVSPKPGVIPASYKQLSNLGSDFII